MMGDGVRCRRRQFRDATDCVVGDWVYIARIGKLAAQQTRGAREERDGLYGISDRLLLAKAASTYTQRENAFLLSEKQAQ